MKDQRIKKATRRERLESIVLAFVRANARTFCVLVLAERSGASAVRASTICVSDANNKNE